MKKKESILILPKLFNVNFNAFKFIMESPNVVIIDFNKDT